MTFPPDGAAVRAWRRKLMPWRIQGAEENLRQALRQAGGGPG